MTLSAWLAPFFLALRGLLVRPWRTLLTVIGIFLGVAVVLATDMTNRGALDSIQSVFSRAVGNAELVVVPLSGEETLDENLLPRIQRTQGVRAAAPSAWARAALADDQAGGQAFIGSRGVEVGRTLEVRGIDLLLEPQVRDFELEEGRMPGGKTYEAVITRQYASEKDYEPGDELALVTGHGVELVKITGILADKGAAITNGGYVAFMPLKEAREIFDLGAVLNEVSIQVDPQIGRDTRALESLRKNLEERLSGEAQVIYQAARGQLVPRMLSSYQMGLSFFSIISIFMGAFLIYNTFSMTVAERTRETGMLRAIGMSRLQIMNLVLCEAVWLAILGSAAGLVGGILLAHGLTYILGGIMAIDQQLLSATPTSLLVSMGFGILVTLVAALLPALQAAAVAPLQALRARGTAAQPLRARVWVSGVCLIATSWAAMFRIQWPAELLIPSGIAAFLILLLGAVLTVPLVVRSSVRLISFLVFLVYGREGILGSGNIRRSFTRTTLTVASLMIALIMIIGVGSLAETLTRDFQAWVDDVLGGDLLITAPEPMRLAMASRLMMVPGVEAASPTRIMDVRVGRTTLAASLSQKDTLALFAIDPGLFRKIGDKQFVSEQGSRERLWAELQGGEALFVSSVVADEYDLQPGDLFYLQTRRGEHAFRVAAITTEFTRSGLIITGTYDDLKRFFGESGADQFTVQVSPGADVEALRKTIEDTYAGRQGIRVQTTQAYKSSVITVYQQAARLFEVLSLIGVLIGAMGMVNTMTMNVLERTREIGGLRSMGMTRRQVTRMVLAEAFAMGLIGGSYGLVFGYFVSRLFIYAINQISGYELNYLFIPRPYQTSIIVAIVISQLATLGPARRAGKMNIVEAIKHE
jgi:putative ABC transport system permease protein